MSDKSGPMSARSCEPVVLGSCTKHAVGFRLCLMCSPGRVSSMWLLSSTPTARRIVGWRVSRTAHTSFVLDALEQALHEKCPYHRSGFVHHSDRGSQYVSNRYTERLMEAGIEPSVGSVGDSYDNALAETIYSL
ncbi:hypothetical protein D6851_08330 [Altericroceibacterium spongiae]|uniref:Integrase catalytic domain-containing protein n=1 Tax=Altericroceibacterium spongiae TaxID=2320269 RepID=A0A420EMU4_9SPHN|nr:hypothetical protein D6851_08330 [Altericroceibacterium spongiae]